MDGGVDVCIMLSLMIGRDETRQTTVHEISSLLGHVGAQMKQSEEEEEIHPFVHTNSCGRIKEEKLEKREKEDERRREEKRRSGSIQARHDA